jgi:hypothetical protein
VPKAGDSRVEMIRSLRVARQTAMRARTQTINALKALLVTAPAELREQLRDLSTPRLVRAASVLEPGPIRSPLTAAMLALRILARRYQASRPRSTRSLPSWISSPPLRRPSSSGRPWSSRLPWVSAAIHSTPSVQTSSRW